MADTRIMIVEDEALLSSDLRYQLEQLGYMVVSIAVSGESALKKIEEDSPDLILMDVQIKGKKDGIETAAEIKKQYSIPVIYLTAYGDSEFLERAKITEPYGYLLKPVETRELYSSIEIAVYKARMEKERKQLIAELQDAMEQIKTLSGLIPICSSCKKVRNDDGYWDMVESYFEKHTDATFSHGMCPECMKKLYGGEDWFNKIKKKK